MRVSASEVRRSLLSRLAPWQFVLVLNLAYLLVVLAGSGFDPKTFVTIGDCYAACQGYGRVCPVHLSAGYDGQFAYYIARDPLNASSCLDAPAYRYQRILLPILGRGLALGNSDLIPIAFVAINLISLVAGTALLERMLAARRVRRWFALVYGLYVGVFMSVRLSTVEPLAYGLVIVAIWFGERDQPWLEALAYLLAAFAKETTLIFVAGALLYHLLERRWLRAVRLALLVGLPFTLWQLALYLWLGEFGAGSGGAGNTPFEIIPFNGFWRVAYDPEGSPSAFLLFAVYTLPAVILPAIWGIWVTIRELLGGRPHLYTCLLLANALLLAFVPFSTYREPLGILRFIPGLIIAHLLYAGLRFPRGRPLAYSLLWIACLVYLVAG